MCRGAIFYNNSITYGGREDNYVNSLRCNKFCCCFCCDRALRQRHTFFFVKVIALIRKLWSLCDILMKNK